MLKDCKDENNLSSENIDFKIKYFPKPTFNHKFYNNTIFLNNQK